MHARTCVHAHTHTHTHRSTHIKVQTNAIYYDKTQNANFGVIPPLSSYKTTLKQQLNGEK